MNKIRIEKGRINENPHYYQSYALIGTKRYFVYHAFPL